MQSLVMRLAPVSRPGSGRCPHAATAAVAGGLPSGSAEAAVPGASVFSALPRAVRVVDTRSPDRYAFHRFADNHIQLALAGRHGIPAEAVAVVATVTAVNRDVANFVTVFPSGTAVPLASNLNLPYAWEINANLVTCKLGSGAIDVFSNTPCHVVVDVTGYFTSASSPPSEVGLFVPIDPVRILDTRDPGTIGKLWPGWFVEGLIPGDGSLIGAAAVVNLTGVEARGPGFLTMSAARVPLPGTSNLNFTVAGQVVPNQVITPITQSFGYQVYSHSGAHVVVDYTGYYTGTPGIPRIGPPVNPPPPPIGPTWILRVPKLGLTSQVRAGNSNAVCNAGHSWHWTGTGYMGQEAHVASFAHRTSAGGPYRNIHLLAGGDIFTLSTSDERTYTYQVVDRFLTDSNTQNILDATRFIPGTTYSLIACTEPNFLPTNTAWRIVVTGVLLGWS